MEIIGKIEKISNFNGVGQAFTAGQNFAGMLRSIREQNQRPKRETKNVAHFWSRLAKKWGHFFGLLVPLTA